MNMEVLSKERRDMSACHLVSGSPFWIHLLFEDVTKLEVQSVYPKLQLTTKKYMKAKLKQMSTHSIQYSFRIRSVLKLYHILAKFKII
jgi:predicted nucleotide-binding protein (sugar kinase/HSP70/actin superfamily)